MLLFILYCLLCRRPVADFNTSHVTVYHDPSFYYRIYEAFQYISCYCLSVHSPPRLVGILISIHLMLLFIEQVLLKSSMICHFNTSHVTVYHRQENDRSSSFRISIHLMLLFIRFRSDTSESYGYFNTSHVTVYRRFRLAPDSRR